MSYPPGEVLGRVERRRRYTTEQKVRIVAEARAAGASVVAVTRRHGLSANQVYKCALAGALVIDLDGAYNLRQVSDRLLLGLKGTMSEYELSLMRQRGLAARDAKAGL